MKKSQPCALPNITHALAAAAAVLILAMPVTSQAQLDFELELWHGYSFYYGNASLSTTNTPVTFHRVESPNGLIWQNTGSNNSGSSADLSLTNNLGVLLNEVTNGLWSLTLNVGDPSEMHYAFSVGLSGVDTNLFGDADITDPAYGATIATNPPNIIWTGPSHLPTININVSADTPPYSYHDGESLPGTATNWTPRVPLPNGDQSIFLNYRFNNYTNAVISTPTNLVGGAPIAGWSANADISTYSYSTFSVGGGSNSALDEAVESPGLEWTTDGDSAGWFVQSNVTFFSDSALQSGFVNDYDASWLEATVQGPGTLIFNWNMQADANDAFEFEAIGDSGLYDAFSYLGQEVSDWDFYEVYLEPGTNTLRWTFYNDDLSATSADAAFLDWVEYFPTVDYEADFELDIQRVIDGTNEYYVMFPRLLNAYPPADTYHEVSSPNFISYGDDDGSSSSRYATLQDLIDEIEGGDWYLSFNIDHAGYREYYFTVDASALSSNTIPPTLIMEPMNAATNVATNTAYQWLGPVGFDSLNVYARDEEANQSLGFDSLPTTATTWPAGPMLPEGTNSFTADYTSNDYSGLVISLPADWDFNSIAGWSATVDLTSRGRSEFIAAGGFAPLPITILPPRLADGDFVLSFLTQTGMTHAVEWTTNLVDGLWQPATNFPGDGSTNNLTFPTTNPAAYFRINSQ